MEYLGQFIKTPQDMRRKMNLEVTGKHFGYKFKKISLLQEALTHRSYLNEAKSVQSHNERLEFLGDAVLELVVTEYLYSNFDEPEGILTNWRSALVKGKSLSEIANKLDMDKFILKSRGESKSSGKAKEQISANALEALIGAIYIDGGYDKAKAFIHKNVIINLDKIIKNKLYIDSKSYFQEMMQEQSKSTPEYRVISESGPDHNKLFECAVFVNNQKYGRGTGPSKSIAEQYAAQNALEKLPNNS